MNFTLSIKTSKMKLTLTLSMTPMFFVAKRFYCRVMTPNGATLQSFLPKNKLLNQHFSLKKPIPSHNQVHDELDHGFAFFGLAFGDE